MKKYNSLHRTLNLKLWVALAFLPSLILTGCLFETKHGAGFSEESTPGRVHSGVRFDYYVRVAPLGRSDCQIEIQIKAWPGSGPILLHAPKFYSDNPAFPVQGFNAKDLQVRDRLGKSLVARDTLVIGTALDGNLIAVPSTARSIFYTVDNDPENANQFGIPVPGTASGVDLIDGAYFFILPRVGDDFASQWRTPVDIHLEFLPAPGRSLVGIDAKTSFKSNYGLMFVRGAYDPVASLSFPVRNHEVTLYSTRADFLDRDKLKNLLEHCIRLVEDSLMPLPSYRYFVGENPVFWGVEGSQGYWFKAEGAFLPALHVHELVHTFVGIYSGDYQDPWYKEGMTTYLGNLLPLQTGLIPESTFTKDLIWAGDTIPAIQNFPLSSPYVRDHLFSPLDMAYRDQPNPEKFLQLVYGKGAQASMILDRYILENSQRRYSVFNLVRDLNLKYGTGFTRLEMVGLVNGYTQKNAQKFLHELLDFPGPFSLDSLNSTYSALKAMGRFGSHGEKR